MHLMAIPYFYFIVKYIVHETKSDQMLVIDRNRNISRNRNRNRLTETSVQNFEPKPGPKLSSQQLYQLRISIIKTNLT